MIKHQLSNSLYSNFERKTGNQSLTHYCPGCGHGVVHNLIAEAIDQLGLQDRTIFCSPVGCAVFGYFYFDTGNIQCSHGRAPAVASAIRRVHPKSIIISYQGDGDLAGIGLSHILHAANRGENITVFFINNAIYGMTGGQMAPTSLLGQKTVTTPRGRELVNDGAPMQICELIAQLATPVYVERVSTADPKRIMKTRQAIKTALECQVQGKGFSFVEILSACPINWKKTPVEAREWMIDSLEKVYPLGCFKNQIEQTEKDAFSAVEQTDLTDQALFEILESNAMTMDTKNSIKKLSHDPICLFIAGLGGQGVLTGGTLLAMTATQEGLGCTWVPSYGPEMRGGTAHVTVNISNKPINSPLVSEPEVLIALSQTAYDDYAHRVKPNGKILYNSSLIKIEKPREDLQYFPIPVGELSKPLKTPAVMTTMMLAYYSLIEQGISTDVLKCVLPRSIKRQNLLDINLKAVEIIENYVKNQP